MFVENITLDGPFIMRTSSVVAMANRMHACKRPRARVSLRGKDPAVSLPHLSGGTVNLPFWDDKFH